MPTAPQALQRFGFVTSILLISAPFAHSDQNVYLGVGLGAGNIDLSSDISGTGDFDTAVDGDDSALTGEFAAGLQFDNGLLAEVSVESYDKVTLLLVDSIDYSAIRLGIGYAPAPSGRFGFVGKAGIAFWDVELRESFVFNPGPENEFSTDGEDFYLQIGGEFLATPAWRIGLAYDFSDTEFGSINSIKLNTRFLFGP